MRPLPEYSCWIDLETTGSELDGNLTIEVGAVMADRELNELGSFTAVVGRTNDGLRIDVDDWMEAVDPYVAEMHRRNGLWDRVRESDSMTWQADEGLEDFIRGFSPRAHVALAGSGVLHFDRKFINRDLPESAKCLTYWGFDSGILRRTFQFAGREDLMLAGQEADSPTKAHRGEDDARAHLAEFRHYVEVLRSIGARSLTGVVTP